MAFLKSRIFFLLILHDFLLHKTFPRRLLRYGNLRIGFCYNLMCKQFDLFQVMLVSSKTPLTRQCVWNSTPSVRQLSWTDPVCRLLGPLLPNPAHLPLIPAHPHGVVQQLLCMATLAHALQCMVRLHHSMMVHVHHTMVV